MKKCDYKNLITYLLIFSAMLFSQAGCQYAGLGTLLGTPSYDEAKIPAEYDLAKQFNKTKQADKTQQVDKKILVLVDQPAWLDSQANLRLYLTRAIRQNLMIRAKLKPENLITYEKLVEFRSSRPDFSSLAPVEIGRALDANMVLLILIENYQLKEVSDAGYLAGNLDTRAVLYDAQTGDKLWPQQEAGKSIKVGFEVETNGPEVAISRLAVASAFCTTRYLYDCQKARFRIAEDRTNEAWENWK